MREVLGYTLPACSWLDESDKNKTTAIELRA